jgi:hypothetical protein
VCAFREELRERERGERGRERERRERRREGERERSILIVLDVYIISVGYVC